jgi:hypothetical protein
VSEVLEASRIALLGDLSGHLKPLLTTLAELGVQVDSRDVPRRVEWPDDLVVVQVGDLVHKGPVSELVVAVVDGLFRRTGRWVQLLGNHEAQYLPGGRDFWVPRVAPGVAERLVAWWDAGFLRPAVAVEAARGPVLVTHAGLTRPAWQALGEPDAVAAAAALADPARHDTHVFRPGMFLDEPAEPGVTWTDPVLELRSPWLAAAAGGVPMPFSQVHGHARALRWSAEARRYRVPAELRSSTRQDRNGHVITQVGERAIVGIDPGAGARPRRPRALVLSGRVHLA